MIGAGKYDEALTLARRQCGSTAALLIVISGEAGPGFSCQADLDTLLTVPAVLRAVAAHIEADLQKGKL